MSESIDPGVNDALPTLLRDDDALLYTEAGTVAHLVRTRVLGKEAFCGLVVLDWWGTGSQSEYDKARALPLCRRCAGQITPYRLNRS